MPNLVNGKFQNSARIYLAFSAHPFMTIGLKSCYFLFLYQKYYKVWTLVILHLCPIKLTLEEEHGYHASLWYNMQFLQNNLSSLTVLVIALAWSMGCREIRGCYFLDDVLRTKMSSIFLYLFS